MFPPNINKNVHLTSLIILMRKNSCVDQQPSAEVQDKGRYSSSTAASEPELAIIPGSERASNAVTDPLEDERYRLLQPCFSQQKASQKLLEKAVTWMQASAYVRDLHYESMLLSTSILYASFTCLPVDRTNLQSILVACLRLGCKLTSTQDVAKIGGIVGTSSEHQAVLEWEQEILAKLDYNPYFELPVLGVVGVSEGQTAEKFKFLVEVLLLRECGHLYQENKIEQLSALAKNEGGEIAIEMVKKIRKVLKKSSLCGNLINKYRSKFDVDGFITKFTDINTSL